MIRPDDVEPACARRPERPQMILRIDEVAALRIICGIRRRPRLHHLAARADEQAATLLRRRPHGLRDDSSLDSGWQRQLPSLKNLLRVLRVLRELRVRVDQAWTTIAMPMPPPMHNAATPRPPPRFCSA